MRASHLMPAGLCPSIDAAPAGRSLSSSSLRTSGVVCGVRRQIYIQGIREFICAYKRYENDRWLHAIAIEVSPRGGLWLLATCDRFVDRLSLSVARYVSLRPIDRPSSLPPSRARPGEPGLLLRYRRLCRRSRGRASDGEARPVGRHRGFPFFAVHRVPTRLLGLGRRAGGQRVLGDRLRIELTASVRWRPADRSFSSLAGVTHAPPLGGDPLGAAPVAARGPCRPHGLSTRSASCRPSVLRRRVFLPSAFCRRVRDLIVERHCEPFIDTRD